MMMTIIFLWLWWWSSVLDAIMTNDGSSKIKKNEAKKEKRKYFLTLAVINVLCCYVLNVHFSASFKTKISQTGLTNFLYYHQLIKKAFVLNSNGAIKKFMIRNQWSYNKRLILIKLDRPRHLRACLLLIDKILCATLSQQCRRLKNTNQRYFRVSMNSLNIN